MQKIFRTIFSRFSLIAISVVLQILAISLLINELEDYYLYVQVSVTVVSWLVLITLPFRTMPQEAKNTWLFLVLGFPPFGAIAYLLFSKNIMSNRQKRTQKNLDVRKDMYNYKEDDYNQKMENIVGKKYFGQMEYIFSCTHQIGFKNTNTKFYSSGELYFEDLIDELKKAKDFIFIEYFIIEPGKFLNSILDILEAKVKEGVEVRLMFDDIGSMTKLPTGYCKKLRKMGINVVRFNRFFPLASAIHNNRDHRKIVVIDGKVGFTGGINVADEYINETHPFGEWKDTGIRLFGQAVDELSIMFLTSYDLQIRRAENIDKYLNRFDNQEYDGVVLPYGDGPRPVYQEYIGENVYINMINQAEKYIYITTPYLIIDSRMRLALQNAAKRGVDVRIVTPHIPDKKLIFMITRSSYERLQKDGVKIYEYEKGFIHAKQVICDGEVGIIGTINFDYRSLLHHYENAIWMYKTKALEGIKEDFTNIFNESIDMSNYKQNRFVHFLCKIGEVFQPLL